MKKINFFSSLTPEQKREVFKWSEAAQHYERIIEQPTKDFSSQLRIKRHHAWLKASAQTILNLEHPQNICADWSLTANEILQKAFETIVPLDQQKEISLWALGKLGAHELNLSSDVDILWIAADRNACQPQWARELSLLLSSVTEFGFCLRVDYDLRPGGKSSPLIPTFEEVEDYYGNYGEAWERLAFVRLSPIKAQKKLKDSLQTFVNRFSYRRFIDLSLLQDFHFLRERISNTAPKDPNKFHLKLGSGGIRELELFVHALMVIHGGRHKNLRAKQTSEALKLLSQLQVLEPQITQKLETHYWNLRKLENYVQATQDQQTHWFDITHNNYPQWVNECWQDVNSERAFLTNLLDSFLSPHIPQNKSITKVKPQSALEIIEEVGDDEILSDLLEVPILSRNKERDLAYKRQFLNHFLPLLKKQSLSLEHSIAQLKSFFQSSKAKASLLSLLATQTHIHPILATIFGKSPLLSQILCTRPEILDSFLTGSIDDTLKSDTEEFIQSLMDEKLLTELIVGGDFLLYQNVDKVFSNLSNLADRIILKIMGHLKQEFPTDNVKILCLGKWGGQELSFSSDLDFIFVSKESPSDIDFKFARRILSWLSQTNKGGSIYKLDLRLRPQGQSGVLIIHESELAEYIQNKAEGWEKQAYTRARWLGEATPSYLSQLATQNKLCAEQIQKLKEIQYQLYLQAKNAFDLKLSPGGLLNIELCFQTLCLVNGIPPESTQTQKIGDQLAKILLTKSPQILEIKAIYSELLKLLVLLRLSSESSQSHINDADFENISAIYSISGDEMKQRTSTLLHRGVNLLKGLDPRSPNS